MKVSLFVIVALLMTATVATAQHQHTVPNVIQIEGSPAPGVDSYVGVVTGNLLHCCGETHMLDIQVRFLVGDTPVEINGFVQAFTFEVAKSVRSELQ